jgi:hypothetical protein
MLGRSDARAGMPAAQDADGRRFRRPLRIPLFVRAHEPPLAASRPRGADVQFFNKEQIMKEHSRDNQIRCLNCFHRFNPKPGALETVCPQCHMEWRLSWPYPGTAKIRGPVWSKLKEHDESRKSV